MGFGTIHSNVTDIGSILKMNVGGILLNTSGINCNNIDINGWPILPHGGGAAFPLIGYLGKVNNHPADKIGATYGEYMPLSGRIYAGALNYYVNRHSAGIPYKIMAAVYGSDSCGASIRTFEIGTTLALDPPVPPLSVEDATYEKTGSLKKSSAIEFVEGEYIGIYVDISSIAVTPTVVPSLVVEGTLYIEFDGST